MEPNLDQEIATLQQQLRETAVAQRFFETDCGILFTKIATAKITKLTRDITSDKYRKDPQGYNIALSDLQAYQGMLRSMQVAGSPVRNRKIKEKLGELEDGQ